VPLAAWSSWLEYRSHDWSSLALGPSAPSCFSVLLVPYQATSMMPGALPAATHGKTFTLAGAWLMTRGFDQVFHSLSVPGGAHE